MKRSVGKKRSMGSTGKKRCLVSSPAVSSCRSGIASLELVMGAPFIIALGAAILMVGYSGLKRTETIIDARHQAWKMRDPSANTFAGMTRSGSDAMNVMASPSNGNIQGQTTIEFETYSWLGGSRKSSSKVGLLYQSWDHRQLSMFQTHPGSLHLEMLGQPLVNKLNRSLGVDFIPNPLMAMRKLAEIVTMDLANFVKLDPSVAEQVQGAQDDANAAEEELERRRKGAEDKMNEEYDQWKEVDDLIEGTDGPPPTKGLQKEFDEADKAYNDLLNRDPPPTAEELRLAKEKRDRLEEDLGEAKEKRDKEWGEYEDAREEWEAWEEGVDDLEDGGRDRDADGDGRPDGQQGRDDLD